MKSHRMQLAALATLIASGLGLPPEATQPVKAPPSMDEKPEGYEGHARPFCMLPKGEKERRRKKNKAARAARKVNRRRAR